MENIYQSIKTKIDFQIQALETPTDKTILEVKNELKKLARELNYFVAEETCLDDRLTIIESRRHK